MPKKVLFLCTGNSCRSQMAEALVNSLHPGRIQAFSAGVAPSAVDPRAVAVLAEIGLDISGNRSKDVSEFDGQAFDAVITLCDHARETCPIFNPGVKQMHFGFEDPPILAANAKSEEEAISLYRRVRDQIKAFAQKLPELLGKAPSPRERLIFALDVPDPDSAQKWIALLSPEIGVFKVGLELFTAAGPQVIESIRKSGANVFLDLKLFDIPKTVERAMAAISRLGVDLATVHCAGGGDMLKAAATGAAGNLKVLGVTVLTSMGEEDARACGAASVADLVRTRTQLALSSGLSGVICSPLEAASVKTLAGKDFLAVCPGIRPSSADINDQKRIATPGAAIAAGADYLVIGRPIRDAKNPVETAKTIKEEMLKAGTEKG